MSGQLDLFTGEPVDQAAPAAPKPTGRLEPGQVRYVAFAGHRDCDDCWRDQRAAEGAAPPRHQRP